MAARTTGRHETSAYIRSCAASFTWPSSTAITAQHQQICTSSLHLHRPVDTSMRLDHAARQPSPSSGCCWQAWRGAWMSTTSSSFQPIARAGMCTAYTGARRADRRSSRPARSSVQDGQVERLARQQPLARVARTQALKQVRGGRRCAAVRRAAARRPAAAALRGAVRGHVPAQQEWQLFLQAK